MREHSVRRGLAIDSGRGIGTRAALEQSAGRSNNSDYLLTGLVKCARCQRRYVGAAANGNGGRYRYYVCFSRQRYGRSACNADSLPADELEQSILDQLTELLGREDEIRQEIQNAFAELDADKPKREAELEWLDAELRKTNDTLDRYFHAFEHKTMPEQACAPRIANSPSGSANSKHTGPNSRPPTKTDSNRSTTTTCTLCKPTSQG
jgi:site-specific DNA recombinase